MKSLKVPCPDSTNGLYVENIPEKLDCLNTLEEVLITKILLF